MANAATPEHGAVVFAGVDGGVPGAIDEDRFGIAPGDHVGGGRVVLVPAGIGFGDRVASVLRPGDEIWGGGVSRALDHSVLGAAERGIEHVERAVVLGDAHRPDLVIVAGGTVAGAKGVGEGVPGEAVRANDVLDGVVVGESEVEEVEFVAVGEDFDVADFREAESTRGVHGCALLLADEGGCLWGQDTASAGIVGGCGGIRRCWVRCRWLRWRGNGSAGCGVVSARPGWIGSSVPAKEGRR